MTSNFVVPDSIIDEECHQHEQELHLGMVVKNQDEAYDLYNNYALSKGFGIRKQQPLYKGRSKQLRGYIFVCSKEGRPRNVTQCRETNTVRYDTRTGCNASITFIVEDDAWVVSKFNDDHNHSLVPPDQRRFIRSGRKISDTSKSIISSMVDAGIKPTQAYAYLAKESGGIQNMECTERDVHNFLQFRRSNTIGPGDAQSLINHFKEKLVENPLFFHHEQLDEENRLKNVFWSDGTSRVDYDCFGDVVVFDTTYRTNKYNMICAPFVGVNNHWKNVYFGCAFLQDEKVASFEWVFQTFLEAMGGKYPKTIFTDQDKAMKAAIKSVFPNSIHRLCTWHISKNAGTNIQHLYGKPDFKNKFNYLLKCCEVQTEFESKWESLMEEFGVSDNKWLKKLYKLRDKWSPAYNRDIFSADIRSTQRSESTNNVFQQNSGKTMSLIEFVHRYDNTVDRMREIEKEDDYNCFHGKPFLSVRDNSLFKHAASIYTRKNFKMFEDEFLQCMSCRFVEQNQHGSFKVFSVRRRESCRDYVVQFDPSQQVILCSCRKFESMGLLCRHTLCILNSIGDTNRIPDRYVLKRWTKNAKKTICGMNQSRQTQTIDNSKLGRLNNLMRRAFTVMSLSSEDSDKAMVAHKYLDQLEAEVCGMSSMMTGDENTNNQPAIVGDESDMVLDPLKKWPKGVSYGRQKGHLEKRTRKRKIKTTTSTKQSGVLIEAPSMLHGEQFLTPVVPFPAVSSAIPVMNIDQQLYCYPTFQSMLMNFHRSDSSVPRFDEDVANQIAGVKNKQSANHYHHQD